VRADLSNKVALVTGSSQGIGKAIAVRFAENGADVVVNARHAGPAMEVVEQIRGMGRRAHFEQADIHDRDQVDRMARNVTRDFGDIDILVANGGAAGPPPQPFLEIDPDSYLDCVRSHLFSRLYCIRAVLSHMVGRGSGTIIAITTDAGRVPTKGESLIGGAAAGLVLMTKTLARENAQHRVRINTICTTVTKDTPGYEKAMAVEDTHLFRLFQKAEERMPFGMNKPDDIARLALFLASEDSSQITGQLFSISGGLSFPG
jgi:2-hydroxycyclohexanecarboxyl-CoA dehydrogenase